MLLSGTVDYVEWLKHHNCNLDRHNQYNLLFRDLSSTIFESLIDFDDNRVYETLAFRDEYDGDPGMFPEYVSMLEIIRCMAIKCEELTFDASNNESRTEWFWQLLSNVGLDKFSDDVYHDHGGGDAVKTILNKIIQRKYKSNGEGGLYPMKRTVLNQRNVDLWYQMNEYVIENYY